MPAGNISGVECPGFLSFYYPKIFLDVSPNDFWNIVDSQRGSDLIADDIERFPCKLLDSNMIFDTRLLLTKTFSRCVHS